MKILYIHPVGVFGGATKSLVEMMAALPVNEIASTVIVPRGTATASLEAVGASVIEVAGLYKWDNTRFSYYRGLRWLILLREFYYLIPTLLGLLCAKRKGPFDIIHCNEISAILPALLAKKIFKAPLIMHVRSLQRSDPQNFSTRFVISLIEKYVDEVVAIDEAVRQTLPVELPVTVIYNGLQVPDITERPKDNREFVIAIIGVLIRGKGVWEFVKAAQFLKKLDLPIKMLVVGENPHVLKGLRGWLLKKFNFAEDIRQDLEDYVKLNKLEELVTFTGFQKDIELVYSNIDALCFPSHLDAPGRPVFEAALYGLPSIVAMKNPTEDVIIDGQTGLIVDQPEAKMIADCIAYLATKRDTARAMGVAARSLAVNRFDRQVTASQMMKLYTKLYGGGCRKSNPS